jgi:hypothetical protein
MFANPPSYVSQLNTELAPPSPDAQAHEIKVHTGTFRTVAIVALQNVLFLLRIASESKLRMDSLDMIQPIPQSGRLRTTAVRSSSARSSSPIVSLRLCVKCIHNVSNSMYSPVARVPDTELVAELNKVIDETFDAAEDAHLNAKAKDIVTRMDKAQTIPAIVSALADADHLNTEGLEKLGGAKFSVFTPSPGASASHTPGFSSGSKEPLNLNALSEALVKGEEPEVPAGTGSYFSFAILQKPERLVVHWPTQFSPDFLKASTQIAKALREEKRDPGFVDYVAFHIGYQLLNQGQNPFNPLEARFLGTVGFRQDAQTYVSLTDPGDGHVFGTTRRSRWMKGAIVHVEREYLL